MGDPAWKNGDYTEQPALNLLTAFEGLAIETPDKFNQDTTPEKLPEWFAETKKRVAEFDANNPIRQSQAIMAHDVSGFWRIDGGHRCHGQSPSSGGAVDHRPHGHARACAGIAKLPNAEVLELHDNCGHLAPGCEVAKLGATIAGFLAK